ncbi:MAG: hypothetical protein IT371_18600 [Deltaproteobacteria bacterium]|nr:hypothetical protein [Deltaproteobacteria bacterium]
MNLYGAAPAALRERLDAIGARGTAVLVLAESPSGQDEASRQAWQVLELLAGWRAAEAMPARLAILDLGADDDLSRVRSALVDTAVRYVTGALFHGGPAVNLVRPVDATALTAAFDTVVALASGLMDAVRGQVLVVHGPKQVEHP